MSGENSSLVVPALALAGGGQRDGNDEVGVSYIEAGRHEPRHHGGDGMMVLKLESVHRLTRHAVEHCHTDKSCDRGRGARRFSLGHPYHTWPAVRADPAAGSTTPDANGWEEQVERALEHRRAGILGEDRFAHRRASDSATGPGP